MHIQYTQILISLGWAAGFFFGGGAAVEYGTGILTQALHLLGKHPTT
jgi:hypothetical protein